MSFIKFTKRQQELQRASNPTQALILMYIIDMISLSIANDYRDEYGEIYCVMSDTVLCEKMGISRSSAIRNRKELVSKNIIRHKVITFTDQGGYKRPGCFYYIIDTELRKELGL